jgi:hypothetical protein
MSRWKDSKVAPFGMSAGYRTRAVDFNCLFQRLLRWARGGLLRRQRPHAPVWQVWLAAMRTARVKAHREGGQTPDKRGADCCLHHRRSAKLE